MRMRCTATVTHLHQMKGLGSTSFHVCPHHSVTLALFPLKLRFERLTATIPAGKGRVVVKDPARWHLSGGYPASEETDKYGAEAEFYVISVFHQLHCLVSRSGHSLISGQAMHHFHFHMCVLKPLCEISSDDACMYVPGIAQI
jgi:hypothetical protein